MLIECATYICLFCGGQRDVEHLVDDAEPRALRHHHEHPVEVPQGQLAQLQNSSQIYLTSSSSFPLDNCAYRPFPEHACDCEGHEAVGGKSQVQGEAAHVVLQIVSY